MGTTRPDSLLSVGRFGRAHGVRGQIVLNLSSDRSERAAVGSRVWADEWFEIVASSFTAPGRWVVTLRGVAGRDAAEALTNREVWAEPIDDPDAVWVHQVIGARVVDAEGVDRGRCVGVVANPADDLLELESGALVPGRFVTSVVESGGAFIVTVAPPAGLFEVYED